MTDLASILSDRLAEGAFALVLILLMLQVGVLLVTLRLRFSIPRLLRTALPLLLCFLPFAVFVSLPRQIREFSLPVLCRDPEGLRIIGKDLILCSRVIRDDRSLRADRDAVAASVTFICENSLPVTDGNIPRGAVAGAEPASYASAGIGVKSDRPFHFFTPQKGGLRRIRSVRSRNRHPYPRVR